LFGVRLIVWRKQFRKRGFTVAKVQEMLRSGRRELYVHPEKGHAFTKIYDPQGNWIVVDRCRTPRPRVCVCVQASLLRSKRPRVG
jgi:hypothetical protein